MEEAGEEGSNKMKMKKIPLMLMAIVILSLVLFLGINLKEKVGKEGLEMRISSENVTLITLYDNYEHNPELRTGWGFSCLVKTSNKTILFDTGGDSETLLYNMGKLGIDPKTIDVIVLSHIHGDHTGGLSGILEINFNLTVYLPRSFPASFKKGVKSAGASVAEVSGASKISDSVYTTGELGTWIKEQSLILKTGKGLIIITGCAHPGVVNIIREAKGLSNENIHLVLGGFHLMGASDPELKNIINSFREFGVEKTAPCHCSGDRTRELFKEEYKEDFISNGVGKVINIRE